MKLLSMQVITSPLLSVWRQPVLQSSVEEGGSGYGSKVWTRSNFAEVRNFGEGNQEGFDDLKG